MNIFAMAFSGVLFILGLIIGHPIHVPPLSIQPESSPTIKPTIMVQVSPRVTPSDTQKPIPSSTPNPSATVSPQSIYIWKYPSSMVTNENTSDMTLQSSDDAGTITTWYNNQLKAQGFHSVSQAKTNTNGNILNKLAASNNDQQVNISIQKKSDSPTVTITISLTQGSSNSSVHIEIKNNSSSSTNKITY